MQFYLDRVKFNGVHSTSSDFSEYTATEVVGHKALRQTIIKQEHKQEGSGVLNTYKI